MGRANASSEIGQADILASIGRTPLIRVRVPSRDAGEIPNGVEVFAKGEHLNPGGSVKDLSLIHI